MALTTYDTTIYDEPTYKPTFAGTQATTSRLNTDYGDFVTNPPIGTAGPGLPKQPPGEPLSPTTPPKTPPATTTTPTTTTTTTPTKPPLELSNPLPWVQYQYQVLGPTNPGLTTENPAEYWAERIREDNGAHSEAYWANRMGMTTAEWGRLNPDTGSGSGSGGTGTGINLSGINFGNLFDDPSASQLMTLLTQRINQLTTPINDPNAAIFTQAIQNAMTRLGDIQNRPIAALSAPATIPDLPDYGPQFAALQEALKANTNALTGPTSQYRGILDNLVSELSKPAFSDDQLAQLKTAAVDTLNHEHQTALDNKARAMGMQGVPPSSGVAQHALQEVDAQYQTLKAQALQAQNVAEIAQINQRRDQLMQAASQGFTAATQQASLEQQGLLAQLNAFMNQRTQDINLRGQTIEAQDAARTQELAQRAQEISLRGQDMSTSVLPVTLAQALTQFSRDQRTEQNTNFNQAVQLAGIPVDLSAQRLSQALQVLGLGAGSTSPKDLLSSLASISQMATLGNTTNNTQSAALWKTIGDWLATFNK